MTKEELAKKKGLIVNKEELTPAEKLVTTIEPKEKPKAEKKNPVGKPKKRKAGDKKLSLWLDEDLVQKLYGSLSYGDTVGEFVNKVLREYFENH